MRYTLTYTTDPNAYDWGDTDTIVFHYPKASLPDNRKLLDSLIKQVLVRYGLPEKVADEVLGGGWWFTRCFDVIDVVIEKEIK